MEKSKPKLALLGMGTLSAGNLGVPVMIDLFERLSADFTVVFYSFLPIDDSLVPSTIVVRQPVDMRMPGRVKYFLVALRCLWDHLFNPFSLFFSVSIYPTSRWAIVLGRLLNRPVLVQLIATEAGTSPDISFGNLAIPWLRKITLDVCRKADAVVVVADYQKKFAVKNLETRKEIAVLPLRVNTKKFFYQKHIISHPVQFIQIAFYSALKDQDTLFAAFSKVAQKIPCHLTVVGEGFNVPKVHAMMNDLKIADHVTFTGFVENNELPRYLNNSHILLHTALFETGCAVIQEAMASGVVVAGTDVGILSDIGDAYAVIVPTRNAEHLAEKIIALVHNPARYEKIRDTAYQFISTYGEEWSYRNYRDFITSLIQSRS
jgi:glycosyltransferase involved in cell wall biosynthesis